MNKFMTDDLSVSRGRFYYTEADDGIPIDNDWELMQFTGLLDKNGKEIYEGDIINHANIKHSVVFDRGCFLPFCIFKERHNDVGTKWTEVIGNIHEHPELLK